MSMRVLATATAVTALAALAAGTVAASGGAAKAARVSTVAAATTVDYRVVVKAEKTSNGAAPTAAATVTISRKVAGRWQPLATHRLPGTYFWKVVTAPAAICSLSVTTGSPSPHVSVTLLETPSIGCGQGETFPLPAR
jgi:hypothetical protein